MTKAEVISEISEKTGIEKIVVKQTVETMMEVIKDSMKNGKNVYLRGFGSFILKKRAKKMGRIIKRNTSIVIPEHNIPSFKPTKEFKKIVHDVLKKK